MSIPTYKDRMDVLSKIVCFYKKNNKGGHIPVTAFGIESITCYKRHQIYRLRQASI